MFFRNKFTRSGKAIQLIESFRDREGRPRQHIVLSLGDACFPQHLWKAVAQEVQNRLSNTLTLLAIEPDVEHWVERVLREIERKKSLVSKTPQFPDDVLGASPPDKPDFLPEKVDSLGCQDPQNEPTSSHSSNFVDVANPRQCPLPTVSSPILPAILVNPSTISHRHTTELGPELVVLRAWEELQMDLLLKSLGFNSRQAELALLSVANRLIDPCSEHALPDWVNTTSFLDLLQHIPRNLIDDHFYRITDQLLKNKNKIEISLAKREQSLFSLKRAFYLYDTSNTYFEGVVEQNSKAQRSGNSKEMRTDAKQIAFGLVLDEEGFVIKHETFAGNIHDSRTLFQMIDALEQDNRNLFKPMIVMDGGLSGEENLQTLRKRGYDYISIGKRPTRIAYEDDFNGAEFREISGRENKEPVSIAFRDEENERIVLCHSEARGEKERAILSTAEKRFLQDTSKLSKRLTKEKGKGCLKSEAKANQALGRIRAKHPRVARYYELSITVEKEEKLGLVCKRLDEKYLQADRLCGSYYMRCSRKDLSDEEIWKFYIMLTRVESGFRALKSDLGLRPIFHHREDRCDSHIFITVLAYRMLHWIEYMLKKRGDTRSWTTIRRVLQTHCYTTITCPSEGGDVYHIRAPGVPDVKQTEIYNALGVSWNTLPRNYVVGRAKPTAQLKAL